MYDIEESENPFEGVKPSGGLLCFAGLVIAMGLVIFVASMLK